MSLRVFHIIFVILCVALSLWVAVWGFRAYMHGHSLGPLALAITFLLAAAVLVIYGKKVYVKLRDLP